MHPDEDFEELTTTTTVALRYAHGQGQVQGLRVTRFAGGEGLERVGVVPAEVSVHEIGINLGSSFAL